MSKSKPIRRLAVLLTLLAASIVSVPGWAGATSSTPSFSTGGVGKVAGSSVQLLGNVVPAGHATSYFFEYGPTTAYGSQSKPVAVALPTGLTKTVHVGQSVTGIQIGWHYRIVGIYYNSAGVEVRSPGRDKQYAKMSKTKVVLGKSKEDLVSTVYGGSALVTGSLTGSARAGQSLSLEATPYPFTAPFTTLGGTVVSGATGSFSFRLSGLERNTEVRVATLTARPIYSTTITVHVTPRITLHVRSVGHTHLFRLYGTVTPARNGAPVQIEQLLPQKAGSNREGPRPHAVARTVLKRASSSKSRFSVIVRLSGNYRYRAAVKLPRGALDSGNSGNVLIKAPGSPKKS